jgi:ankyrin repeat protein
MMGGDVRMCHGKHERATLICKRNATLEENTMNTNQAGCRFCLHPVLSTFTSALLVAVAWSGVAPQARGGAIHDAADKGDAQKLVALLKDNPDLADSKDDHGWTPLHWAASEGHKEVAVLLLIRKVDVNARDNDGATPLHRAAICGQKGMVELLLAYKADIDAKDPASETPLHWAASNGDKEIVDVLLSHKADVNAKGLNGATPLHEAAFAGYKEVAEVLLACKAEVNAKDKYGRMPLHMAAYGGRKELAELLLAHKADLNAKADNGLTPLGAALQQQQRINDSSLDVWFKTIELRSQTRIINLLRARGAKE